MNTSTKRKDKTMNITTLRVVDLDELLEDCPEVLEMMSSTDLPWTSGDCRYSLISRSDLHDFIEGLEEGEAEVADHSNNICKQCALAIEHIATLPEDVLIYI
jgi:hypothetical protein